MVIPLKTRFLELSEEDFFLFCQDLQELHVEREANGTILLMELTGGDTGNFNADVTSELSSWSRKTKTGKTFDSNTGFTLPNNAIRSPDTAWIAMDRWKALPTSERKRFAHISPDFVLEIRSETDALSRIQAKMKEYQENGVRLGWLINPQDEEVWIYRADGTVSKVDSFDIPLSGEDVMPGFELRLAELWEPED